MRSLARSVRRAGLRMNRSVKLLMIGAVILFIVLLALAASQIRPYQELVEKGPTQQAHDNPYLAAERFLAAQGRTVTRSEGIAGPIHQPATDRILLLLGDRTEMSPSQSARLLDWVADGGHLVFVAERLWDEHTGKSGDLLLDALDLQQYETIDDKPDDAPHDQGRSDKRSALTRLYLENEAAPAFIAFDTRYHLYDAGKSAHAWANSDAATHMLQLKHEEGLVTALTDSWIWQNDDIGRYDHAWLLWYLTQDREVTMVYGAARDGLPRQLLRHFPEVLIALLMALLFLAWHLAQRQGPIIETSDRGRRRLQEHLRASADFIYRHAGPQQLLVNLQHNVRRHAQRRHPGFDSLSHTEQCQVLAKLSHLSVDTVDQALRPPSTSAANAAEFTRQAAHLQSLRNAL